MRLSHRDIQELQNDTKGWVARRKAAAPKYMRMGYRQATKLAIHRFHRDQESGTARRHLLELLDRHELKNVGSRATAEHELGSYMEWWQISGVALAQQKLRIAFPLTSSIILGGEIPRVDIELGVGDYRGILLGEQDPEWGLQLRAPVLQGAIAHRLHREVSEVKIGVQSLDGSGLNVVQYEQSDIADAIDEVRALAQRAQRLLEGR